MWFKEPKKTQEEVLPKRTKKIIYKSEKFEVEKYTLQFTDTEGKTFNKVIYGFVRQTYSIGIDPIRKREVVIEPFADKPYIIKPMVAEQLVANPLNFKVITNDENNPTECIAFKVVSVKIIKTEPHEEIFNTAYVVEV